MSSELSSVRRRNGRIHQKLALSEHHYFPIHKNETQMGQPVQSEARGLILQEMLPWSEGELQRRWGSWSDLHNVCYTLGHLQTPADKNDSGQTKDSIR